MPRSRQHTIRIGVTGGIGSGKSAVCRIFEGLGVTVLYADDIARELSQKSEILRRQIIGLLGGQAYLPDGSLDRSFVAERIFGHPSLQKSLNAIVHPAVLAEINRRSRVLADEGHTIIIVEAALIYESGLDKELDAVLVVDADESERVRRVMERDKVSEEAVRKRIRAQWPVERKLRKADYVLRNNGSLDALESRVRFFHRLFQKLTQESS